MCECAVDYHEMHNIERNTEFNDMVVARLVEYGEWEESCAKNVCHSGVCELMAEVKGLKLDDDGASRIAWFFDIGKNLINVLMRHGFFEKTKEKQQ